MPKKKQPTHVSIFCVVCKDYITVPYKDADNTFRKAGHDSGGGWSNIPRNHLRKTRKELQLK